MKRVKSVKSSYSGNSKIEIRVKVDFQLYSLFKEMLKITTGSTDLTDHLVETMMHNIMCEIHDDMNNLEQHQSIELLFNKFLSILSKMFPHTGFANQPDLPQYVVNK